MRQSRRSSQSSKEIEAMEAALSESSEDEGPQPPQPKCDKCRNGKTVKFCHFDKFNRSCIECDSLGRTCFINGVNVLKLWKDFRIANPDAKDTWQPPTYNHAKPERRRERNDRLAAERLAAEAAEEASEEASEEEDAAEVQPAPAKKASPVAVKKPYAGKYPKLSVPKPVANRMTTRYNGVPKRRFSELYDDSDDEHSEVDSNDESDEGEEVNAVQSDNEMNEDDEVNSVQSGDEMGVENDEENNSVHSGDETVSDGNEAVDCYFECIQLPDSIFRKAFDTPVRVQKLINFEAQLRELGLEISKEANDEAPIETPFCCEQAVFEVTDEQFNVSRAIEVGFAVVFGTWNDGGSLNVSKMPDWYKDKAAWVFLVTETSAPDSRDRWFCVHEQFETERGYHGIVLDEVNLDSRPCVIVNSNNVKKGLPKSIKEYLLREAGTKVKCAVHGKAYQVAVLEYFKHK